MTQNRSHAVMAQRHEAHDSLPIISRADAVTIGQRWYFTGEPCKNGHVAKRNCSNHDCRGCTNQRTRGYRKSDPNLNRSREKRRREKNPDEYRARLRASRSRHVEKRREYDRQRYHECPERKEWQKKQATGWGRANKGKRNFIIARRRSGIEEATPKWLTPEQRAEIRAFYVRAKAMGEGYQVDHIVPLRGRGVCGLHVPWNLQILTKAENIAKGNRYEA